MYETKSALASKSVWGGAIAIIATGLNYFGVDFNSADQAQAAELLDQATASVYQLVAIGGMLLAIYGRVTATKKIGK